MILLVVCFFLLTKRLNLTIINCCRFGCRLLSVATVQRPSECFMCLSNVAELEEPAVRLHMNK